MEFNVASNADMQALFQTMSQIRNILTPSIAVLHEAFPQIINDNILCPIETVSRIYAESLPLFTERMKELLTAYPQPESAVDISEEALESMRKLGPFVPEEDREKFEVIVAPHKSGKGKRLTPDKIKYLLSLIATILSIFYYVQAIATGLQSDGQQKLENDNQQKELELREDELEMFREFFEYIKENGVSVPGHPDGLVEQVEPFAEQADGLNDSAIPNGQANDDEALDDVQNSQE